jgi:signal transduction histidine kinase
VSRPFRPHLGSAPARLGGLRPSDDDPLEVRHQALLAEAADLRRRLDYRNRQLATLNAIAAITGQSLDLAVVLPAALDKTLEVMGLEAGIVFQLERDTDTLVARAWRSLPAVVVADVARLPLADSSASLAAEAGRPVVEWVRNYDPGPIREQMLDAGLVQIVAVPLGAQGQLLGAMILATGIERPLSESEQDTLAVIGRSIGVAMANAQLLDEAQRVATIEERQRLARELHDSVTQLLYSLTLLAEAARRMADDGLTARLADTLGRLGRTAQQALKEMRLLVYELRPSELETEGLVGAVRRRLDSVERRSGIQARLVVDGHLDLPARTEAELYRVVQEVLNNTLKHAQATDVQVRLAGTPSDVTVELADNGRGFDPAAAGDRGGLGLASIRERATRLGAEVAIESAPGRGAAVRLVVPRADAPANPAPEA